VAWVWTHGSRVAYCVGPGLVAAVFLSAILGAGIALVFRSRRIAPAIASRPLITTLNDVVSLLIYFGVAFFVFSWMA
ncbi:MAG: magnesium transporter, partial [Candidatus Latescibacterota bacterium]|nr:magnesium transporter [Candidatus Latescibacterota bacterium]